MTISDAALAHAVVSLRAAGCVFAEDEADVLGSAAADEAALAELVRRRAEGEPLEQVVGFADLSGVRVRLRPGVFVPRVRSELLVRRGVEAAVAAGSGAVVVDLCCGSGALGMAVHARAPGSIVYAADSDPTAVACARDNLGDRVYRGDLFDALPADLRGRVDVLLANVPYVATRHIPLLPAEARDHEPHTTLDGGDDGLDVFRRVIAAAPQWLTPSPPPAPDPVTTRSTTGGAPPDGTHEETTAGRTYGKATAGRTHDEAMPSGTRERAMESLVPEGRRAVGGVVVSEITEAQIDAAVLAVESVGLRAEIGYDEDLEATVIMGHR
jgi:release factor glutamine methyltransferase